MRPPEGTRRRVFDTAWGPAAVCWTARGIRGLLLPGPGVADGARALWPDAREDPGGAAETVRRVRAYFDGRAVEFPEPVDLSGATPFRARVYRALRGVKRGRTVTYGELAARAGGGPRAVGGALAANPVPLIVPCHRVVRADGGCGGFSAPGGVALKRRMLELERRCGPSSSRFLRGGTEARAGNAAPGPMGSAPPFVRRARRSRRRDGARPPVGGTAGGAHR